MQRSVPKWMQYLSVVALATWPQVSRSAPLQSGNVADIGACKLTWWVAINCSMTLVVAMGLVSDARSNIVSSVIGSRCGTIARSPYALAMAS